MTRTDAYTAARHAKKRRGREASEDRQSGEGHGKRRRRNHDLPEHPPSTFGSEMDSNIQYDTCFGLVELPSTINTSSAPESAWFPVDIELSDGTLKINAFDSEQHMGSVSAEYSTAIHQLREKANVMLTATVLFPHGRNRINLQYVRATLRVVVYGSLSDADTVAWILSDDSLHLQHPSPGEYTGRVPYFNPQYLLRPGGSMPDLESLNIPSPARLSGTGLQASLTGDERSRLLQVFESAHDPDATSGIRPSKRLQSTLKDHQITALAMMVEKECGTFDKAVFPTLWEPAEDDQGLKSYRHVVTGERRPTHPPLVHGGILADEMGLGKTLSAIALILWHLDVFETSKSDSSNPSTSRATLIVTPKSTIPGWREEFEKHVKAGRIKTQVHHGSRRQLLSRAWRDVDVVLTTYDTLRSEKESKGPLFDMHWARVILDEAHNIRNRSSKVFAAAQAIKAQNRWCLTGTPIQNRLDDYGALLSFIGVPSFEAADKFNHWVAEPVKQRRHYAFKRLRTLVEATCLRRTKQSIGQHVLPLPKKEEVNELLDLDPADRELYNFFRAQTVTLVRDILASSSSSSSSSSALGGRRQAGRPGSRSGWYGEILPLLGHLRRICDHGQQLLHRAALRLWQERHVAGGSNSITGSTTWLLAGVGAGPEKCVACRAELEDDDGVVGPVELPCGHYACVDCFVVESVSEGSSVAQSPCSVCFGGSSPLSGVDEDGDVDMSEEYRPSVKIQALLRNLAREHGNGCKSVVFTCWTAMLDFIEKALRNDGISYRRIDGQTTLQGRIAALAAFRNDAECKVMIASIGSVAEGVNLSVANHVHIMEPHWNPMVEAQAVDRVHRMGQTKDVVITRYLIKNSIEFYVRGVQEDKLRLIHQSLSSVEVSRPEKDERRCQKLLKALR